MPHPKPTTITVARHAGRTVVVLGGEHDISTVERLTDTMRDVIDRDRADVVVDLHAVEFMSAATVGAIVRTAFILRQRSRVLTVQQPSKFAQRLLDLCGLADLIEPVGPAGVPVESRTIYA